MHCEIKRQQFMFPCLWLNLLQSTFLLLLTLNKYNAYYVEHVSKLARATDYI